MDIVTRTQSTLQPVFKFLLGISGVAVFAIMIVTTVDVVGRSFFHMPLEGGMEVNELIMLFVGFTAFIAIEGKNGHLIVDLLYQKFSEGGRAALRVFQMTASVPYMFILAWELHINAVDKTEFGDLTEVLGIPIGPFYHFVSICLFILALSMCITLLTSAVTAVRNRRAAAALAAGAAGIGLVVLARVLTGTNLGLGTGAVGGLVMLYLFLLILSGMPIGYAMCTAGIQGLMLMMDMPELAYGMAACAPYPQVASFNMTVIPMFILLGELALFGNVSKGLFDTASSWMGHLPGGVAIATVGGCAGFAAVCGDSIATAMTMATVSLPEMEKRGYNKAFGAACLSVGGTLGILIPPSMGFIFYAVVTEESVGKLFMAGVLPGILLTLILMSIIYVRALLDPSLAPRGPRRSWAERFRSLHKMLPMIGLFTLIMGGILSGICTPTEGGAVGAFGCLLYALCTRTLTLSRLYHACTVSAELCGRLFLILVGVGIMGYVLAASNLPTLLADLIAESGIGRYMLLIAILLVYILLGMLMNVIPMIMLILPAIFPCVVAAGFDPVWFGVITVLMMELGQITPPVGVLVFAMAGVISDVPMSSIFRHVTYFFGGIMVCVLLLVLFPQIALYLPSLL